MAFAPSDDAAHTRYPLVRCDLADVRGAPGVPRRAAGRRATVGTTTFRAGPGGAGVLLRSAQRGAAAAFESSLRAPATTVRTVASFRSPFTSQRVRQQRVRGRPIVGARYRVVETADGTTVLGAPLAWAGDRAPERAPQRHEDEVADAARDLLELGRSVPVGVERVVFPLEGTSVWAYRARVADGRDDVRAYLRADDLSLLYAQDVTCAMRLGEGRVFRVHPGRDEVPEVALLEQFAADDGLLAGLPISVVPASGRPISRRTRDFRFEPDDAGFDHVCAYHHAVAALALFTRVLGPDVVAGAPFTPLRVVVQDPAARRFVGLFLPGRGEIALADHPVPVARSGDVCVHEMAHALVHRIARLDDEFATAIARGVNEGIADYVQASMFDDPRFGDWVRAGQDGGRRCDDRSLRLPADPQDPDDRYRVGAAVAALLWDVRAELGRGVTDAIVLHSLAFLAPGADYEAVRGALHLADATLFPARRTAADTGRHRAVIDEAVDHRLV